MKSRDGKTKILTYSMVYTIGGLNNVTKYQYLFWVR